MPLYSNLTPKLSIARSKNKKIQYLEKEDDYDHDYNIQHTFKLKKRQFGIKSLVRI